MSKNFGESPLDLKELDLVDPEHHWYYQSKFNLLLSVLRQGRVKVSKIVDVGAGSGFFSQSFICKGVGDEALCIDPGYASLMPEKVQNIQFQTAADSAQGDLYLFLDVLEHVKDDQELLSKYVQEAPIGANFLISVPAFQSLWSYHDEALGHFRRYRLKQLVEVTTASGLNVQQARYLFPTLAAIALVKRRMYRQKRSKGDLKEVSAWLNKLLKVYFISEPRFSEQLPFGLTALVFAKKLGGGHVRKA